MPISFEEFQQKAEDIEIPDSELARYFQLRDGDDTDINPTIVLDPGEVAIEQSDDPRTEGAIAFGFANSLSRRRRKRRFKARVDHPDHRHKKVLVTEGDSWFQFPFLLDDVVDHLVENYNVYSVGAAGDTTRNMIFTDPEYLDAIDDAASFAGRAPDGFCFSSGGNDILGDMENPQDHGEKIPVLEYIVREHDPGEPVVAENAFIADRRDAQLELIRSGYQRLIADISTEFPGLPVFIHAYGRVFPFDRHSAADHRKGKWIQPRLRSRNIDRFDDQRKITDALLGHLKAIHRDLAGAHANVHFLETSNPLAADLSLWHDEIHPTSRGYGLVVDDFVTGIDAVIG